MVELNGARVLLVEDEYYIADDVRRTLREAGATIVGPVSTVEQAHRALDEDDFECAVVDLNLHDQSAVPIAERLLRAGKSFALATGYANTALPEALKDVPRIEKPFDPRALLDLVAHLRCANAD